jgi:hypothetical protein
MKKMKKKSETKRNEKKHLSYRETYHDMSQFDVTSGRDFMNMILHEHVT